MDKGINHKNYVNHRTDTEGKEINPSLSQKKGLRSRGLNLQEGRCSLGDRQMIKAWGKLPERRHNNAALKISKNGLEKHQLQVV